MNKPDEPTKHFVQEAVNFVQKIGPWHSTLATGILIKANFWLRNI